MPPDSPLLAFDTSAAHCAAALLWHGKIVAEAREEMAKGQAERLMPMIEEMLAGAGLGWRDLGALAVGIGPGNFTGIRISVAAARGLALGLGVPAVGVTGLEALGHGTVGRVWAAVPATRGALYVQAFVNGTASGPATEAIPAQAHFWPDSPEIKLVGDWPAPPDNRSDLHILCPPQTERLRAIAHIGAERAHKGAALPAPFYMRAADAAPPSDPPPIILDALP